jgi:hypothetical protein
MMWRACWRFALTAHRDGTFLTARTAPCRSGAALKKSGVASRRRCRDFGVEIVELIEGEDNAVTVQALLGGTMPADVPGVVKKGEVDRIAHAYIIRYNADGKITRLDCYWDNTAINAIKASAL